VRFKPNRIIVFLIINRCLLQTNIDYKQKPNIAFDDSYIFLFLLNFVRKTLLILKNLYHYVVKIIKQNTQKVKILYTKERLAGTRT